MATQTNSLQTYTPAPNPRLPGGDARYLQNELNKIGSAFANIRFVMQQLEARLPDTVTFTFATLPASPSEGRVAVVTDSNTAVFGAAIAGGGTNHVLACYLGGAWKVG